MPVPWRQPRPRAQLPKRNASSSCYGIKPETNQFQPTHTHKMATVCLAVCLFAVGLAQANAVVPRVVSFDDDWKFYRGDDVQAGKCPPDAFPVDLGQTRCLGLSHVASASTTDACNAACCLNRGCETWQFCPASKPCDRTQGCWVGKWADCQNTTDGWISRARNTSAPQPMCASPFCMPSFDDKHWRTVDTPHDWSSEDLPSRENDTSTPVLTVRNGTWKFHTGDNASWSSPNVSDAGWSSITVPSDWRDHPISYDSTNAFGWFRREITVTGEQAALAQAGVLALSLGTVSATDETFLNGVKIGSTGSMGKPQCRDYLQFRRYMVPPGVLVAGSRNLLAVRVFSSGGPKSNPTSRPGGLFDSGAPDMRTGAFDAGASPGQKAQGYSVGGVGWYRKTFVLEAKDMEGVGHVSLRFDGVYMNSQVWFNGHNLGLRPYGYSTFEYDVTSLLAAAGKPNVVAVRAENLGQNSRWYSGSGIYRHVWLCRTPSTHFAKFGVRVFTPRVGPKTEVALNITVNNQGSATRQANISATVLDPKGNPVGSVTTSLQVGGGASSNVLAVATLTAAPELWSPSAPSLYNARVSVGSADGTDTVVETFGIRTLAFSATRGFQLNGETLKLFGGCVHHDNGILGSAAIDRADERRVEILKANGYNAIRTSHNPVSPAFLDACDRLGVVVMDEAFDCFDKGKNPDDYHLFFDKWWREDIETMVHRDFNHPSIIMWSIGNEIPIRTTPQGAQFARDMAALVHALDSTGRAVTSAIPGMSSRDDEYCEALDVCGYNYSPSQQVADHQTHPDRIIVGTETFPKRSYSNWEIALNHDWVLGDFIWTAIDYIGESGIGSNGVYPPALDACPSHDSQPWPYHTSYCGDIDLVGLKKPQAYYRNVLWNVSSLEMAVHAPIPDGSHEIIDGWGFPDERQTWTWPGYSGNLSVNVYSRLPHVQLTLNGKPMSKSSEPAPDPMTTTFVVPYTKGTLKAMASDGGQAQFEKAFTTAGAPLGVSLVVDRSQIRASRTDLAYVTAQLVDSNGVLYPADDVQIAFSLSSDDAELAAVGTGNPNDVSSTRDNVHGTHWGACVAIVRPRRAGTVTVTASSPGLADGTVTINMA
eukprot:m.311632 g.311632  ORF g.311632 m.311632 type:complete len:1102 (-) comp19654_c1_seq4:111-3416(-)